MRKQGAELEQAVQMQASPVTLILDGYRLRLKHNREPAYLQSLAEEAQQRIVKLRTSVQMPESRWVHLVSLLLLLDELKGVQAQCVELQEQVQNLRKQQALFSLPASEGEAETLPSQAPVQERSVPGSASRSSSRSASRSPGARLDAAKKDKENENEASPSETPQWEFPPFGLSDSIRDRQRTLFAYLPVGGTDET